MLVIACGVIFGKVIKNSFESEKLRNSINREILRIEKFMFPTLEMTLRLQTHANRQSQAK